MNLPQSFVMHIQHAGQVSAGPPPMPTTPCPQLPPTLDVLGLPQQPELAWWYQNGIWACVPLGSTPVPPPAIGPAGTGGCRWDSYPDAAGVCNLSTTATAVYGLAGAGALGGAVYAAHALGGLGWVAASISVIVPLAVVGAIWALSLTAQAMHG